MLTRRGLNSLCWRHLRCSQSFRLYSTGKDRKKGDERDEKSLTSKQHNEVSKFKTRPTTSSAAPAPMDNTSGIQDILKKDVKPYVPKLKHERLTYEYPGLPYEDEFNKSTAKKSSTRWSRYVPKILTGIVVGWGAYVFKVWYFQPETGANSTDLLDPEAFHKFVVSHKEEIDDDHYLIELTPKHTKWQYSYYTNYEDKSIWNGDHIWSVDIKQPDIMVVRSYTPLPLFFIKSEYTRSGERKPLLKVINNDVSDYDKQGRMCLYVKRYDGGEVSKYITSRKPGDELELRGPNTEYRFPYHPLKKYHQRPIFRDLPSKIPAEHLLERLKKSKNLPDFDNLDFYAAGTGIAPILQVLFSRNPYRGFVNIHYSAQKEGEIKPFDRFLFFLEKIDRIKLSPHYDTVRKSKLAVEDINEPQPSHYTSPMQLEMQGIKDPGELMRLRESILKDESKHEPESSHDNTPSDIRRYDNAIEQAIETSQQKKDQASLAIVCGPDGYVEFVAGAKGAKDQGPIGGLLGRKKWDNSNVHKL